MSRQDEPDETKDLPHKPRLTKHRPEPPEPKPEPKPED
jgi:hypothetical protein